MVCKLICHLLLAAKWRPSDQDAHRACVTADLDQQSRHSDETPILGHCACTVCARNAVEIACQLLLGNLCSSAIPLAGACTCLAMHVVFEQALACSAAKPRAEQLRGVDWKSCMTVIQVSRAAEPSFTQRPVIWQQLFADHDFTSKLTVTTQRL